MKHSQTAEDEIESKVVANKMTGLQTKIGGGASASFDGAQIDH